MTAETNAGGLVGSLARSRGGSGRTMLFLAALLAGVLEAEAFPPHEEQGEDVAESFRTRFGRPFEPTEAFEEHFVVHRGSPGGGRRRDARLPEADGLFGRAVPGVEDHFAHGATLAHVREARNLQPPKAKKGPLRGT